MSHDISLLGGEIYVKLAANICGIGWNLRERSSRSQVNSQGHDQTNYLIMTEADILTVWHGGSVI